MIRLLTKECFGECFESEKSQNGITKYTLTMNERIWKTGRELFQTIEKIDVVPVINEQHELVCFAWQDKEANRELRMLQELETCGEALNFRDLYPDCTGIIIHGCNELAWYMMKYLENIGIAVIVEGIFWEIFSETISQNVSEHYNYEIWAEGVYEKNTDWRNLRLRSVSVEFECVDKIYEANIKAGRIKDAEENGEELLSRLKKEKEIVIRGLGTKAQDAYDWLIANGIDICAFQSDRAGIRQNSLFGRPIVRKAEVVERFKKAVILECGSIHSAWGFGEVDDYDYYGYKRNERYILLRDYVDVPSSNLRHILAGKNVILTGEVRLCSRIYRWLCQNETDIRETKYWNLSGGNPQKSGKLEILESDIIEEQIEDTVFLLVLPKHFHVESLTQEAAGQFAGYYEQLERHGVYDYSEYFSEIDKMIYLETEVVKYVHEELRPAGILLGAIPGYCGNELVRDCLQNHPQIIMMKYSSGIGVPLFLDIELYTICIRLAEESADNILPEFWKIYEKEADRELINNDFPEREKFHRKMKELLELSDRFSSQELFVMFHLAYLAMYGKEISSLKDVFIYWEPHWMPREYIRKFAYWLGSNEIKGSTLIMVRNRYIVAGSSIRGNQNRFNWRSGCGYMYNRIFIESGITHQYWDEQVIRFEDLKCYLGKILKDLYEWMGVSCESALMEMYENTCEIGQYDLKPAYNLYEDYFTGFDRMRISLVAGSFQKQYGYPYESCLNFSRRELQELFLKDYRWERLPGALEGKTEEYIIAMQFQIRKLLWMQRFSEVMEVVLDEEF